MIDRKNIEHLTDEQILQIDFYDFCGINALWMSDKDKIEYYKSMFDYQPKQDGETIEECTHPQYVILGCPFDGRKCEGCEFQPKPEQP